MEESAKNVERCGWVKYSETKLIELEKKILQVVKTGYRTFFVPVGSSSISTDDRIWTILLNEESKNTPLVMLHGFAAALGFWCLNFDSVATERPVYAIDLLGFGRSSRPKFSADSLEAEQEMVRSLEEWRKQMEIEKFVLLGHSFGGYLAASYSLNHPERVKHLILADPWGFAEQPAKIDSPLWVKTLKVLLYPLLHLNPLATVRAAGPIGPWLVRKVRQDISEKYGAALDNKDIISEYIYHCNSQNPTGESAFHNMCKGFIWAKNPMVHRIHGIREDIPITFLFGERSWVTKTPAHTLKEQRPNSFINIEIIQHAGHHINADQPMLFNEVVTKICKKCDISCEESFDNDGEELYLTPEEIANNNEIIEEICSEERYDDIEVTNNT